MFDFTPLAAPHLYGILLPSVAFVVLILAAIRAHSKGLSLFRGWDKAFPIFICGVVLLSFAGLGTMFDTERAQQNVISQVEDHYNVQVTSKDGTHQQMNVTLTREESLQTGATVQVSYEAVIITRDNQAALSILTDKGYTPFEDAFTADTAPSTP